MRVRSIAASVFAISLLIASYAAARGVTLLPFTPYPSGENPIGLASADFDGDGDQDLAVSQFDGDGDAVNERGVAVFGNQGGGSLQFLGAATLADQPDDVVARRIDGDDDPDLVIGTLTGEILLLRGGAGASFLNPEEIEVGGAMPRHVAVGDVNGDDRQDIVFSTQDTGRIGVVRQRANETFKAPRLRGGGGGSVATAGLNGDGRTDVVATGADGKVRTLLGRPNGELKLVATRGGGPDPADLDLGDLNADGDPDVAIANSGLTGQGSNVASVIPGLGGGKLGQRKTYDVDPPDMAGAAARRGSDALPKGVVITDLGDSPRQDLAVTLEEGADLVAVLRSKAGQQGIDLANPDFFPTGPGPRAVIASQLDGVAGADLAIARGAADAISVLLSLEN